jgi:hypothetical protein
MQAAYADKQISEGHACSVSQSDIIRNQLSNYHRVWHNFAFDHGYILERLPWATERMKDTPKTQAVTCGCGQRQTGPENWFCSNCNAAFDPLAAFLAGKNVPPVELTVYDVTGPEWKLIVAESQRRKAMLAMLDVPLDAEAEEAPARPTRSRKPKPEPEADAEGGE